MRSTLILKLVLVATLTFCWTAPVLAAPQTWNIDRSHTTVGFKVRHNMVSWVTGRFGTFEGTVVYDPEKLADTRVEVTIDPASIDTGNKKRDSHLRNEDFFDVEKFPGMSFKSTKVSGVNGDGSFQLLGDLTMHGVTAEVTLDVSPFTDEVKTKWGSKRGTSARGALDRKAFGITWSKLMDNGGLAVGNEVHFLFEIELNLAKEAK